MPYSATIIRAAEETKARTIESGGDSDNKDSPAYRSSSYSAQLTDVEFVRMVFGGTKTMRKAGKKLLKPHPMESEEKWQDRRDIAVAFNAGSQTVGGMNGMIFRRDPTYSEDMPEVLQGTETEDGDLDNIDLQGRAFNVFWRAVADNALTDGHTWVHVESPRRDSTIRTRADERESGFRPYWINLTKQQVINWRYDMRAGRPVLTLVAYRESAVEADGEFGEVAKKRIRVLREADVRETEDADAVRQIVGELWEFREKSADAPNDDQRTVDRWVRIEFYTLDPRIEEIPVVAVYAERTGIFESEPPLRELAYEQAEHYRVRSERQKSMTFSSIAVPYAFGRDVTDEDGTAKIRWSPDGMLLVNDPETKAGMLESHGYGLEATREELQDIEARMARQGLQMLVQSSGTQPQTATAEIFEKSESDAWLSLFASNLEDAANQCLGIHAQYRGIEEPGKITLNDDFHDQLIDAGTLREINGMVTAGNLSLFTMWEILKRGGTLPEEHNPDEELQRLAAEEGLRMDAAQRAMFTPTDDTDEDDEDLETAA